MQICKSFVNDYIAHETRVDDFEIRDYEVTINQPVESINVIKQPKVLNFLLKLLIQLVEARMTEDVSNAV